MPRSLSAGGQDQDAPAVAYVVLLSALGVVRDGIGMNHLYAFREPCPWPRQP